LKFFLSEKNDENFRFKNEFDVYLVTKRKRKLFQVQRFGDSYTLEAGGFYLGVHNDSICVFKTNKRKETWFQFQSI